MIQTKLKPHRLDLKLEVLQTDFATQSRTLYSISKHLLSVPSREGREKSVFIIKVVQEDSFGPRLLQFRVCVQQYLAIQFLVTILKGGDTPRRL